MTNAPLVAGPNSTPHGEGIRRNWIGVVLFALGAVAVIAGASTVLIAKTSIIQTVSPSSMPTLPVFGPTLSFPHRAVPDYTSLDVGLLLAGLGILVLLVCAILAVARPRVA
jgi:hypothetical protein